MPQIRSRLLQWHAGSYSESWQAVLAALPSTHTLQRIVTSLLGHLSAPPTSLAVQLKERRLVRTEAWQLRGVLGAPSEERPELWDALMAAISAREWDEGHARVIVCWISGAQVDACDEDGECFILGTINLLTNIMESLGHPAISCVGNMVVIGTH